MIEYAFFDTNSRGIPLKRHLWYGLTVLVCIQQKSEKSYRILIFDKLCKWENMTIGGWIWSMRFVSIIFRNYLIVVSIFILQCMHTLCQHHNDDHEDITLNKGKKGDINGFMHLNIFSLLAAPSMGWLFNIIRKLTIFDGC